jgi:hypothetical protein
MVVDWLFGRTGERASPPSRSVRIAGGDWQQAAGEMRASKSIDQINLNAGMHVDEDSPDRYGGRSHFSYISRRSLRSWLCLQLLCAASICLHFWHMSGASKQHEKATRGDDADDARAVGCLGTTN